MSDPSETPIAVIRSRLIEALHDLDQHGLDLVAVYVDTALTHLDIKFPPPAS